MAMVCFTTSVPSPGTPVRILANASPSMPTASGVLSGGIGLRATSITFQSAHGNTAGKYFYIGNSALNVASKAGIGMEVATGSAQLAVYPAAPVELNDLFIDTDGVAGDKLYVMVAG